MNFDTKFSNVVHALFLSQQAYITDTSLVTEHFKVEIEEFKIDAYADNLTIGIGSQDD
ncbi:18510_t:CDS:2 [Gigaspora rosea]|nr:18510_t:CDS:2 [Gigaspora rosea]